MAVYIDNYGAPFGRMIMCHMIADSTAELLEMAEKIGVQSKWVQKAGTYWEHFDVCLSKRELAIKLGAVAVTPKDLVRKIREKRTD